MTLKDYIKMAVAEALHDNGGNQTRAAQDLEISRVTLRKYMNKEDSNTSVGRPRNTFVESKL